MIFLGFDPGGVRQFGWCVSEAKPDARLRLLGSGVADHARGAVQAALTLVTDLNDVCAAGIDSPLYWPMKGDREADLRNARLCASTAPRTLEGQFSP
jgi:hypothetical protein